MPVRSRPFVARLVAEVVPMTEEPTTANEVTLRGRVSSAPEERTLPSGSVIVTFRVSVPRAATTMTQGSRQTVDWLDCVAWSAGTRRRVGSWAAGDEVEVVGALRRRFYRGDQGTSTRVEVEVLRGRRLRRPARRAAS